MKSILNLVLICLTFSSLSYAEIITEKYCSKKQNQVEKELKKRIKKGELSIEKAALILDIAKQSCLVTIAADGTVEDYEALFKPLKKEDCDNDVNDLAQMISSQSPADRTQEEILELASDLLKQCEADYLAGTSQLEYMVVFKLMLKEFGLDI